MGNRRMTKDVASGGDSHTGASSSMGWMTPSSARRLMSFTLCALARECRSQCISAALGCLAAGVHGQRGSRSEEANPAELLTRQPFFRLHESGITGEKEGKVLAGMR